MSRAVSSGLIIGHEPTCLQSKRPDAIDPEETLSSHNGRDRREVAGWPVLSYDNLSTRPPMAISVRGTAPTVTLPDGTKAKPDIAGATAEWIVERPAIPGQTTRYNFPDYGHTEFDICGCSRGRRRGHFLAVWGHAPKSAERAVYPDVRSPRRTAFISMPQRKSDTEVGDQLRRVSGLTTVRVC